MNCTIRDIFIIDVDKQENDKFCKISYAPASSLLPMLMSVRYDSQASGLLILSFPILYLHIEIPFCYSAYLLMRHDKNLNDPNDLLKILSIELESIEFFNCINLN